MLAIYLFSALPAKEVAQIAGPVIATGTKTTVPFTIGKDLVQINWLKVGHVIGYGLLGASYLYAFGLNRRCAWLWALLAAALYAVTDEYHQQFIPGRSAGWTDVIIDTGAAGAVLLIWAGGRWLNELILKKKGM